MPTSNRAVTPQRFVNLFKAAIVVLVALEAIDETSSFLRRASKRWAWWLTSAEQHERRRFRFSELAFLMGHLDSRQRRPPLSGRSQ